MEFSSNERTKLLICSSQADAAYLEQLPASVQRHAAVEGDTWDEARLAADAGYAAFAQALQAAKLVLLFISPETLTPDYLTNGTVLALLEAARQEGAQVLCIITRPCAFEQSLLAHFPTINPPAHPVSALPPAKREQLWKQLAAQVRGIFVQDTPDATVIRRDLSFNEGTEELERVSAEIDWDRELQAAYEAVHGADQQVSGPQALLAAPAVDLLHFMVCAPGRVAAETWETLLFYTHVPSAMNDAYQDAALHTQNLPERRYTAPAPTDHPLPRGVELTIVPQGAGLTFNPSRITYRWLEDWQQSPFRFSASRALVGTTAEMELAIYAGVLLLTTVKVTLPCGETTSRLENLPTSEQEADASQPGTTCFRCGAANPPGRRFCLICNYDLAPRVVPNFQAPQETWLPFIHARLTLMDSPSSGQHFNLHEHTITTIGRAPGNDIILSDPSISRHHAQFRFEAGRWVIEDKNSSLGTYVNGRRIRWPQPIADGDQLRLAHTILLFTIVE